MAEAKRVWRWFAATALWLAVGVRICAQSHLPDPPPPQTRSLASIDAGPSATAPIAAMSQPVPLETQSVIADTALAVAVLRPLPLAPVAPDLTPVAAAAEQPEPVTPVVAGTVTAQQLQALPVSGRHWEQFELDTPASSTSPDSSQASFRGAQDSAQITIDGANTRLAFGVAVGFDADPAVSGSEGADRQSSMSLSTSQSTSQSWTGGRGLGVSEAAVYEVTTAAGNVAADGARSASGRISITTQSGANALHGQGFFFDRQNSWGAQNPFTQWVQNTGSATSPNFTAVPFTPPDHEMVWGFGAGSQIRRDKLFWFAALDSYHRNDPGLAAARNPIGTGLYGDCVGFFCQPSVLQADLLCAQLGLSVASPVGPSSCPFSEVTADYSQMLETLDGLLGPAPRTAAQWVGFARIDWQAAERHRFTLEGIGVDWNSPGGGFTQVEENDGNHSFGSSEATQEWLLARWEAYLTPNLLAITQGSAGRAILSARPDAPSAFESGFLGGWNTYGQLPQIVVDSANGFTIGNPSRFGQGSYPDEKLYHGQEMLDWVHGRLLVKAGFELDHNGDATSMLRNQTGTYHYSHVANFISDALAFEGFGPNPSGAHGNAIDFHNCDQTGKAWYASTGQLMGLGALPCYSSYSQTIGPTFWRLSTNDWAGYATAQWQPGKFAVFSAGLRWELEQLPPPIALVSNPDLPLTQRLPNLGNQWGPRVSLAIGGAKSRWPVLRLGYGMYYGRTENSTIESALTQTGSLKGDLSFFIRPTDGLNPSTETSGAPQFPDVLTAPPASVVVPGALEFAPPFRNPEVHQAVAAIEQPLPGHVQLTASAMLSLGRRLPVYIDTNFDPAVNPGIVTTAFPGITYTVCDEVPNATGSATVSGGAPIGNTQCGQLGLGPIKAAQITVPFYASWPFADCPGSSQLNSAGQCGWLNPNYQQISEIESRANSTYEAAIVKLTRYGRRGLSLHAHYTYAHAMDWNPNESPMDPANFSDEYGTSNLDVRHSAAAMVIYETPWNLRKFAGHLANGWMLSGIGQFRSGLPYTMRVGGSVPEEFDSSGNAIVGLRPGMNGSGGDSRVYGLGSDGDNYNIGRNTFRYPQTWKADARLARSFHLGEMRELQILAESFNLFNHQNVTALETTGYEIDPGNPPSTAGGSATPPTLTYLTGLKISTTTGLPVPAFGQPLNINGSDFYRERQIQLGLRVRF